MGIGELLKAVDIWGMNWFEMPLKRASRREFYRVAVILGISIFLVLAIFQPFGTYNFEHSLKYALLAGYGFVIALSSMAAWELARHIRGLRPGDGAWTLRREFTLIAFVFLFSASATFVYQRLVFGLGISASEYLLFMGIAATTAIFPVTTLLIVQYIRAKTEWEKHRWALQHLPKGNPAHITLRGENKHETITLLKQELLFLRSADNYVEVFLLKNRSVERLMLRIALSRLAAQLDTPDFIQTHRSYIVHLHHRLALEGRSPNHQLRFETLPELDPIPVSKTHLPALRSALAQKPR